MTTTYSVSGNDIVNAALRLTNRYGASDTIPAQDLSNVLQALNILTKSLVTSGYPLWAIETVSFPTVANQAAYPIGPSATGAGAVVADRPMKIVQCFIRNSTGQDTMLNLVSQTDYNTLGSKTSGGVPNQAWYYPSIPNGMLTLYDVPQDALSTIELVYQRTFDDFSTGAEVPDFPQEWYQPLKWILADEISVEYECLPAIVAKIEKMAVYHRERVAGWGQDTVPVRFVPAARYVQGHR